MTNHQYIIAIWLLIFAHSSFQCKISKQCNCYLGHQGKIEYLCPKIQITAHPNSKTINLSCRNPNADDANIDEILNEIDIESFDKFNINELIFDRCLLTQNFPNILKKFNISHLESIDYRYENNFPSFNFTSSNFLGLEGITDLILMSANEEDEQEGRLESDTFKYLSELRYLKLSIKLETLPIGVFDNLRYLETLYLPSNNLANLDEAVLKNLNNLIRLDLSDNYLETLPDAILRKSINLTTVNLNYNLLSTLPEYLFANLPKLKQVFLMKSEIEELPKNLFQASNSLEEINLSWNKLQSLPENIFQDLILLQHLDLSNNKIKRIPEKTFNALRSLIFLNLADNELHSLNKNQFMGLKLVETIHLYNNNLSTIPITLFQDTLNLKTIYLANNCLKIPQRKFGLYMFNNNFNLEVISLSNNNLTFFNSYIISNKSKLKELDLRHNQIESISIHHFQSDSSEVAIDLRNNKIASIYFDDVEEISKNRSTIYKDQSILIKLDENPIQCDCFSYNFLKYLDQPINSLVPKLFKIEADNLKCNSSNTLAKNLNLETVTCPLEEFSLPKCSDVCNCFYRPWDNTVTVDCENKKLTKVPKITLPHNFNNSLIMVEEVEINLRNNLLIAGPNVTVGYENITKLFLSSNNISVINWVPPKLKVLELHNNSLSNLDEVFLAQINSSILHTITLGNNPWNCDCSSLDLYKYLISNKNSKHIDVSNITCKQHGKSMILLTPEDLCSITNIYIACAICLAIILIICVMVIIYHYHEDKIKVWLYAHNMCMWFVTEEELDKDKIYDVFISYSHVDEDFILNELQPTLESGPNPYKLCLHVRDWVPGKEIYQQIFDSIEESRRTLVILSSHFLESIWGTLEFRTAHTQAVKEGRARVILVIYGDLNLENLDGELKAYIGTNTYIKWGDPWFWDKLKYALPHRK